MTIKQKIQSSHLLSDQQKINLLVSIDECSDEERTKLDDVLTRHEEEYQTLVAHYKDAVNKELAGIMADHGNAPAVREAVERIRMGMNTMTN